MNPADGVVVVLTVAERRVLAKSVLARQSIHAYVRDELARALDVPAGTSTRVDLLHLWLIEQQVKRVPCAHCKRPVGYYEAVDDVHYTIGQLAGRYTCPSCNAGIAPDLRSNTLRWVRSSESRPLASCT